MQAGVAPPAMPPQKRQRTDAALLRPPAATASSAAPSAGHAAAERPLSPLHARLPVSPRLLACPDMALPRSPRSPRLPGEPAEPPAVPSLAVKKQPLIVLVGSCDPGGAEALAGLASAAASAGAAAGGTVAEARRDDAEAVPTIVVEPPTDEGAQSDTEPSSPSLPSPLPACGGVAPVPALPSPLALRPAPPSLSARSCAAFAASGASHSPLALQPASPQRQRGDETDEEPLGGPGAAGRQHRGAAVWRKRCLHANCPKRPNFGVRGGAAEYCAAHKPAGYVNVVAPTCSTPGCERQAAYGYRGRNPEHCRAHKKPDMVDLKKVGRLQRPQPLERKRR
eukprot:m51a1_g7607 hypothetical protein (338) ;mRNA; r:255202-256215